MYHYKGYIIVITHGDYMVYTTSNKFLAKFDTEVEAESFIDELVERG